MSTATAAKPLTPCCGKPYRTLVKRAYGIRLEGAIKQSVPMGSRWRCLACGKSYTTESE